MRTQTMIFGTTAITVLTAALFLAVSGRAIAATGPDTAAVPPNYSLPATAAASPSPSPGAAGAMPMSFPSGVTEVMKLFKGGIPADIMLSYINSSPLSFYLSADNIIALQQQGVPGPVLTAMIHRYGELQRQTAPLVSAPAQVQVPAQAPAPQYYSYPAQDQATANFNAALQARQSAYNYAYVTPPNYGIYAPAPVYYDPYYYDPFFSPWYPFGGGVVFDFGLGHGGGFGHGGFGGHGGGVGGHGGGGRR